MPLQQTWPRIRGPGNRGRQVIVMGTDSGIRECAGTEYDDEVLNAGWLQCPGLQLQLAASGAAAARKRRIVLDPEEFLRSIYRLQE